MKSINSWDFGFILPLEKKAGLKFQKKLINLKKK